MSVTTNTIQTFDRKGLREDLTNGIYNMDPTDVPLFSNAGRGKCTNVLHEWQSDSFAAAITNNAKVQGDNYTSIDSRPATVRLGNYTQIAAKTALVSGTVSFVNAAGRGDEMDYQLAKCAKEIKRDIEKATLSAAAVGSAGNSSTAATAAGLLAWVKTNVDKDAGGTNPTWTSGVPSAVRTDGTPRAFTETILKSALKKCFDNGSGDVSTLLIGSAQKSVFSAFSGVATKTFYQSAVDTSKIIGAADVYVGEFTTIVAIADRFQRNTDGWLLNFDAISFPMLRPFQTTTLPPGDYEAKLLLCEYTFQVNNELALGLCADLS